MALAKANKFCTEDMETHWLFLKNGQGKISKRLLKSKLQRLDTVHCNNFL